MTKKLIDALKSNFWEIILFAIIVFFSIHPVENFDFWFHVKYGEFISQTHTLPFKDVFSHTTYGHAAIPYEWLFQLLMYYVYTFFGTIGVQILVVFCAFIYCFFFRQILKNIFNLSIIPRIILIGTVYFLGFDFWVERPQSAAFAIFMIVLYLILRFVFQKKNLLWLTIPLFFIWTNLHASMILGLYLFFSFGALVFLKNRRNGLILLGFGIANTIMTTLPPLGFKVYELLILFFQNRAFISKSIEEWVPLANLAERYYLYLGIISLSIISYSFTFYKSRKRLDDLMLYLAFIPLGLFVISGIRQTPFSMPAILILFIPIIKSLKINLNKTFVTSLLIGVLVVFSLLLNWYKDMEGEAIPPYPKRATTFAKQNIHGNMFNEYYLGGYFLYELWPQFKTFIDGRTEMFLDAVLPEYMQFSSFTNISDKKYYANFDKLVSRYNISWSILTTARFSLSWRLARILSQNPNWVLIFFDDTARIYVRKNSSNDKTIEAYGVFAATPFGKTLYRKGLQQEAYSEYQRMNKISPSAVSENALGYILLEKGKFDEGKAHFHKAIALNPRYAPPKMNLAELAAKDGQLEEAISLYEEALKIEPDRGLTYLRLGQLLKQTGDINQALEIWERGLKATPDEKILKQINSELQTNQI